MEIPPDIEEDSSDIALNYCRNIEPFIFPAPYGQEFHEIGIRKDHACRVVTWMETYTLCFPKVAVKEKLDSMTIRKQFLGNDSVFGHQ